MGKQEVILTGENNSLANDLVTVKNEKGNISVGLARALSQLNKLTAFTAESRKNQEAEAFRLQQRNKNLK